MSEAYPVRIVGVFASTATLKQLQKQRYWVVNTVLQDKLDVVTALQKRI